MPAPDEDFHLLESSFAKQSHAFHPALKPHLQRVNHRVAIYKHADESILEKPNPYDDGQGWIRTEDGVLELVWSCDAALPNLLVDLLDTGGHEEEEEEKEQNEKGRV